MSDKRPKTIAEVQRYAMKRRSTQSKRLRKLIDRRREIQQVFQLDKKYANRYSKFLAEYEKATKGMTAEEKRNSRQVIDFSDIEDETGSGAGRIQIRSATKIVENKANFRQIKNFYTKLVPEFVQEYEFGHKNTSILRANIALVLDADKEDPFLSPTERQQLLALFAIVKEIDAIDVPDGTNKLELIEKVTAIAEEGPDLEVEWRKDVDILKGKAGAVLTIEAEYKKLNQFKGNLASWVGTIFAGIIQEDTEIFEQYLGEIDISGLRGSPTLEEDIENEYLYFFHTNLPGDKNWKPKKAKPTNAKAPEKKPRRVSPKKTKRSRVRKPSVVQAQSQIQKGIASQPLQLLGILNERLPQTVMKNMGPPRLTNRTGRFASSVKITDIARTPQGFPSIGYTYQKSPYQTFETGQRQGDVDRDPRRLIDYSIREIAAQLAIGRFYTRRV